MHLYIACCWVSSTPQELRGNFRRNLRGYDGLVGRVEFKASVRVIKSGDRFEVLSTVVNNSPDAILLPAGRCDSPLTAFFMRNVVIRQDQGCTATSPPFELNPGEEVTVAGPVSGTIYQAIKAGKTPATATVYYLTENGNPGNLTKPFVFTIN